MVAAFAEHLVFHHGLDGIHGFLPGLGDNHAFAQCQTVRLDDGGDGSGFQVVQGSFHVVEHLICGGGNMVFLHEVFGEDLAALDDGSVGSGTKAGDADFVQGIHRTQHQRVVRRNHGIVNAVFRGKGHQRRDVRCADVDAGGICSNAAVAGQSVNFGNRFIFFQFLDDGVLSPAATDNHDFHRILRFGM